MSTSATATELTNTTPPAKPKGPAWASGVEALLAGAGTASRPQTGTADNAPKKGPGGRLPGSGDFPVTYTTEERPAGGAFGGALVVAADVGEVRGPSVQKCNFRLPQRVLDQLSTGTVGVRSVAVAGLIEYALQQLEVKGERLIIKSSE